MVCVDQTSEQCRADSASIQKPQCGCAHAAAFFCDTVAILSIPQEDFPYQTNLLDGSGLDDIFASIYVILLITR